MLVLYHPITGALDCHGAIQGTLSSALKHSSPNHLDLARVQQDQAAKIVQRCYTTLAYGKAVATFSLYYAKPLQTILEDPCSAES